MSPVNVNKKYIISLYFRLYYSNWVKLLQTDIDVLQLEELQRMVKELGLNSQDLPYKPEYQSDCWK
jgi:hypothetical protein